MNSTNRPMRLHRAVMGAHRQTPSQHLSSPPVARMGALNELTQTTPIALLAEALGYSPQTLEAHARGLPASARRSPEHTFSKEKQSRFSP